MKHITDAEYEPDEATAVEAIRAAVMAALDEVVRFDDEGER